MLAPVPEPNHLSEERMAMKSSRAFTLIELLIVIAILGILMALLFPAVDGALQSARKAQAKNDVVQIATAITAYETEYGRLPLPSKTTVDSELVAVLVGGSGNTNNPRQITFLEVQTAKKNKSGTNGSGFVDPWGSLYKIKFDDDYDNRISGAGTNNASVMKKVAVWNDPSTHTNGSTAQKNKRYVNSWE
jgi:prepilin-type N-terminal cleavage/methylation domain-containing protein